MMYPTIGFAVRHGVSRLAFPGACVVLAAALAATPALPVPAREEAVELPALVVVDERHGPEWQYLAIRGCEILAATSRRQTEAFGADLQRQFDLLGLLVPDEFLGHFAQPSVYIVFDAATTMAMPPEIVETATAGRPLIEVKRDADARASTELSSLASRLRIRIAPSLFLFGRDQSGIAIDLGSRAGAYWDGFQRSDGVRMRLSSSYLSKRLERRIPTLPDWYLEAVPQLWSHAFSTRDGIGFRKLFWRDRQGRAPNVRDPATLTRLTPEEFLARGRTDSSDAEPAARRMHRELFLRWALEHRDPRIRAGLFSLVRRSATETVSGPMLRECFGLDATELRLELDRAVVRFQANEGALTLPKGSRTSPPRSRPATLVESARLLGEWQRLAASHLRHHQAIHQRYLDEARRNLRRPLEKGMRDVAALATLALAELDSGNTATAGPLLDEAMRGGSSRPAVLFALAELRLQEAKLRPAGHDGRLNVTQSRAILEPLQHLPVESNSERTRFELLAQVWLHGELGDPAAMVETVRESVRLHPHDRELLELGTNALARAKELAIARELVADALPRFPENEERARLELHLRRLHAESAGR